MFTEQSQIGWEQLYYGHIASSWAQYLDHASQYKINGTIFYLQNNSARVEVYPQNMDYLECSTTPTDLQSTNGAIACSASISPISPD